MPGEAGSDFLDDAASIPDSGAVLTFGRSLFGNDQEPGKFWIRNDSVVEIACGDQFTAVVAASGRVFVFGSNGYGQLGLGHSKTVNKPSCIKSLKPHRIRLAAGGRAHTVVGSDEGRVFSFGLNSDGQLGDGTQDDSCEPREIFLFSPSDNSSSALPLVKQLAAGAHHSMALTDDGRVFAWGSNVEGQLGMAEVNYATKPTEVASSISRIACGYYHSAFVTNDGRLLIVGDPESVKPDGGNGAGSHDSAIGDDHATQFVTVTLPDGDTAVDVSCGGNHTLVLGGSGKVYAFGEGQRGQLGLEKIMDRCPTPAVVHGLEGQTITSISCGECHSAAVNDRGQIFVWGDRAYGKLCEENSSALSLMNTKGAGGDFFFASPVKLSWLDSLLVSKVACGGMHTIVLARPRQFVENAESLEVVGGSLKSPSPSKPPSPGPVPPMHLPPMASKKSSTVSQAAPREKEKNGSPGQDNELKHEEQTVEVISNDENCSSNQLEELPALNGKQNKKGGEKKAGRKAKSHVCTVL